MDLKKNRCQDVSLCKKVSAFWKKYYFSDRIARKYSKSKIDFKNVFLRVFRYVNSQFYIFFWKAEISLHKPCNFQIGIRLSIIDEITHMYLYTMMLFMCFELFQHVRNYVKNMKKQKGSKRVAYICNTIPQRVKKNVKRFLSHYFSESFPYEEAELDQYTFS